MRVVPFASWMWPWSERQGWYCSIAARLDALLDRVEGTPKSRSWKLRAKVGERKRWYQLPEEV